MNPEYQLMPIFHVHDLVRHTHTAHKTRGELITQKIRSQVYSVSAVGLLPEILARAPKITTGIYFSKSPFPVGALFLGRGRLIFSKGCHMNAM